MLLSSLYNKPVIENHSAQNLGTICKLHVNGCKIDYLLTSNDHKIDVHEITRISDAIMYKHSGRNYPNFKFFPIANQIVTNEKGKIFGKLVDVMISNDFEIKKLLTDNKNLCSVEILSMSEDTLVFKRIKKSKPSAKTQCEQSITADNLGIATTITNYNFLIGRIIQKNIFANGNLLFTIGKKITKQDVDVAFKYGKILDLTLYSKFYNIENL